MNDLVLELRSAFLLLDEHKAGEIQISTINRMLLSIESLTAKTVQIDTTDLLNQTTQHDKLRAPDFERRRSSILRQIKARIEKKNATYRFSSRRSKSSTKADLHVGEGLNVTNETISVENIDPLLKAFRNGKTTISFREFACFFKNISIQRKLGEELLLQCFRMFDYEEQGLLSSEAVRDMLKLFNQNIPLEEVEDVMNSIGCKGAKMNFGQLKELFFSLLDH